uniref:Calcium-transporting P-type ATPase N-terminal autoinhibitory domain-containing protein n=1 Tax=Oryza punctata TaxID=4537 RepID=A0A0E0KAX8_ORYPU
MLFIRKKSMEFFKSFEVPAKNPSAEAQRRWRDAVGALVKNRRRRRFRMVPDLDMRSQAEIQRRKIQVPALPSSSPAMAYLQLRGEDQNEMEGVFAHDAQNNYEQLL